MGTGVNVDAGRIVALDENGPGNGCRSLIPRQTHSIGVIRSIGMEFVDRIQAVIDCFTLAIAPLYGQGGAVLYGTDEMNDPTCLGGKRNVNDRQDLWFRVTRPGIIRPRVIRFYKKIHVNVAHFHGLTTIISGTQCDTILSRFRKSMC